MSDRSGPSSRWPMGMAIAVLLAVFVAARAGARSTKGVTMSPSPSAPIAGATSTKVATFGGGCFWCMEAVFQELTGVVSVESGFSGGTVEDPTYEMVCTGTTGHAEVIQVTYDPKLVSYVELLEVFFKTHDPTTLNQQGNDHGTQYRSVIFYHDEEQHQTAERIKAALDKSGAYDRPIVTQVQPFTKFFKAEGYHQNYFRLNPHAGYCVYVIQPKVAKFRKAFATKLKDAK